MIRELRESHKPSQTWRPGAYVAGVKQSLYDVHLHWRRKETSLQEDFKAVSENIVTVRETCSQNAEQLRLT